MSDEGTYLPNVLPQCFQPTQDNSWRYLQKKIENIIISALSCEKRKGSIPAY